jgi:hypothetical protein
LLASPAASSAASAATSSRRRLKATGHKVFVPLVVVQHITGWTARLLMLLILVAALLPAFGLIELVVFFHFALGKEKISLGFGSKFFNALCEAYSM